MSDPVRIKPGKGLIRDERDVNDHPVAQLHAKEALTLARPMVLPPSVTLRGFMSSVRDQGQEGACTGFALCAQREALMLKAKQPLTVLSPAMVYYAERDAEGTVDGDSGAQIRTGLHVLLRVGACAESDDPYVAGDYRTAPSDAALADAAAFRITHYYRVFSLLQLQRTLSYGWPVVAGIAVYEGFESDAVAGSGNVRMPEPGEKLQGGHAILLCGYDMTVERILFKNSWGPWWGMEGYGTLPFAYFEQQAVESEPLVWDMWSAVA